LFLGPSSAPFKNPKGPEAHLKGSKSHRSRTETGGDFGFLQKHWRQEQGRGRGRGLHLALSKLTIIKRFSCLHGLMQVEKSWGDSCNPEGEKAGKKALDWI